MTIPWTIAWPLLLVLGLGVWLWVSVWIRLHRALAGRPSIRRGLELAPPPDGWPSVSVIVPAHDEERVIDECAWSLREQDHDDLEIIFVLDRCSDGTAELLAAHAEDDERVVLLHTDRCPDGWAGKCHAAQIGARHASGRWLLFTDADTRFEPELVRAAVATARDRDVGLLSLLGTLTSTRPHERIAQPVATMYLVRLYPIGRVDRGNRSRPFANGQFMLFRRDWYARVGGHEGVRDQLLEDIAFARRLHSNGGRSAVLLADGLLHCSMYETAAAFRQGWKRIFMEACKRKPGRLRKNGLFVLGAGVGIPVAQLGAVVTAAALGVGGDLPLATALIATAGAGLAAQVVALRSIYRLAGAPGRSILLHPLGAWIVGRIMFDGARTLEQGRPIEWAGREYLLEAR